MNTTIPIEVHTFTPWKYPTPNLPRMTGQGEQDNVKQAKNVKMIPKTQRLVLKLLDKEEDGT